jgi:hypothetical protein
MSFAPDFAIVGAPKCGTTALYRYLGDHPAITMSTRKEPAFWASDVNTADHVRDPDAYRALWQGAPTGTLLGEASADYLRSHVAISAILRANPAARFIAMIRNPSDMVQAYYSQLVRTDLENVPTFARAWALQAARATGAHIPPHCPSPSILQYRTICSLGDQLERFCAAVPPGQRLIILFDDFRAETPAVYRQVLSFLGLPDDGRRSFDAINANQGFRFPRLAAWHRAMPQLLGPAYRPLRAIAVRLGFSPSRLLKSVNPLKPRPRPRLSPALAAELAETFLHQVEKLETLLGRDLSSWKRPPGNGSKLLTDPNPSRSA